MRLQVPPALTRVLPALRRQAARARAQRFWLECAALAGCALLAAAVVGRSSLARAEELRREAEQLTRVRAAMDGWIQRFQPAAPAESAAWRESERMLLSLSGEGLDPLTVAGRLASRAEEAGIRDVRFQLAPADSIEPPPPTGSAGWTIDVGPVGLFAEIDGDWGSVLGFLGALPPEVQVASVQISSDEAQLRARALLFTRAISPPQ